MKARKRNSLVLTGLVCVLFLFASVAVAAEWKVPEDWKYFRIAGGSASGSMAPTTAKIAELLNKNIPGIKASGTLGGVIGNIKGINQGKMQMAFASSNSIAPLFYNMNLEGFPQPDTPCNNMRFLFSLNYGAYHIYTPKNSSIKELREIATKPVRIAVGTPGSNTYLFNKLLLELYGTSMEDLEKRGGTVHKVLYGQGVEMMKNGKVDLLAHHTSLNASMVMDAATSPGIRFLEIEPVLRKKFMDKYPGEVDIVIPKEMYPGIKEDYHTMGHYFQFLAHKKMPEELAYRITKAIWDNIGELQALGSFGKDMKWETALAGNAIPIHPGAERYYKEKGITIPKYPDLTPKK